MLYRAAPVIGGLAFLCVLASTVLAEPQGGPQGPKAPPPPPISGIQWEADLAQGLERALREGRPLLFAVNALEDERANIELGTRLYPSAPWGEASRAYVCFVANPNQHEQVGGGCSRYPGTTCQAHRQALQFVLARFGPELISPQHLILEPEGDVFWRKEYYEPHKPEEVSPRNLELALSRLTPALAYRRAQIGREKRIQALLAESDETLVAAAQRWLAEPDGLACAGVLGALDETESPSRRLLLLDALGRTPAEQAPMLVHAAEERVLYPDEVPSETRKYVATLLALDRPLGAWAASRAIARSEDSRLRKELFALWAPGGNWNTLPRAEQTLAIEALLLGGESVALSAEPAGASPAEQARLRRARARADRTTAPAPLAETPLRNLSPALLRSALLRVSEADASARAEEIQEIFLRAPQERLRLAAALALVRGRVATPGLAASIVAALVDAVEGPETRAALEQILGEDPGVSAEHITEVIESRAVEAQK